MQSDTRVRMALDALARPIADFRAALAGALAQAEAYLASQVAEPAARADRFRVELGPFAGSRIDADRFAAVFGARRELPAAIRERLEQAIAILREQSARGDDLFTTAVPPGGSLGRAAGDALADAGRGFGAAMAVDLLRGGRFDDVEHARLFGPLDFHDWTRTERRYAPPLVVRVTGADLHAGALSDFLDGRQRLVLVVDAPCPPAPLVRLITPGTLVLQTADGSGLDQLTGADGPAVAAIVPDGVATFLHQPRGGREPWQRLSIWRVPDAPRRAIGGISVWQMQEDLRHLESLAAAPIGAPVPPEAPGASGDGAVDRLADWLLKQSGLPG
jgi:hypothetical protein